MAFTKSGVVHASKNNINHMKKFNHVKHSSKKQSGIALIQILIIVAILTTVALYISKSAKQQVQMAQWAVDRSQATVLAHGAKADVLFELLTNKWTENHVASELTHEQASANQPSQNPNTQSNNQSNMSQESPNEKIAPWNLYNQAFQINQHVIIQLQDQAGLINLHYPQPQMLNLLLNHAGLSPQQALVAEAVLLDWQDGDNILRVNGNENNENRRNGLLPDIRELLLQNTMDSKQLKQLSADLTLYGHGHLNLMTSSKNLLAALSNEAIANEIIKQRELRDMSVLQVAQVMGLSSSMELYFSPSTTLALTISASFGEANVKQRLMVEFTRYTQGQQTPYNIMQTTGG